MHRSFLAIALLVCLGPGLAQAQSQAQATPGAQRAAKPDREGWLWASACMACHGTGGDAVGVGLRLKDLTANTMSDKLLAFKRGTVRSTVMHQHVAGYSEDELRRIAQAFVDFELTKERP